MLIVAMVVGGAYSGIAGVLKVTRGVNEVISTIMLNAIAISGLIAFFDKRMAGRWADPNRFIHKSRYERNT